RLAGEQGHALGPEDQADRRAGLGVALGVGQVEGGPETLDVGPGADAAGDVELGGDHVLPQPLAGGAERVVAGLGGEIGHGRVQVHGAHGVAHGLGLLAHRQVRLVVLLVPFASAAAVAEEAPEVALGAATLAFALEVVRPRAAGVDQAQREIEVAALAGGAVELDEGQFDLLVAVVAALGRAAGAELAVDEVG